MITSTITCVSTIHITINDRRRAESTNNQENDTCKARNARGHKLDDFDHVTIDVFGENSMGRSGVHEVGP